MNNFIYSTPTKVYFGKDQVDNLTTIISSYNPSKVLLHYGTNSVIKSGLLDRVKALLFKANINFIELGGVKANPSLDLVYKGIDIGKREGVDFVLAIGGGSVLDSAKHIANGIANPQDDVYDYSLGLKKPLKTLKKGCILTLAAAGSEMSQSCVVTNEETHIKRGYTSPCNQFDFAIEDPTLTYSVSPYQTACGIVDIAMHTIERFFNPADESDLTDDIALSIIKNTYKAGKICLENPEDYNARANMMWASSLAHNGLTSCGRDSLLIVHQLQMPISGLYTEVAHGAGLAAIWCSWARYVYKSCVSRFKKYCTYVFDIYDSNLTDEEIILKGLKMQEDFYHEIGMPTSLEELNIKKEDLELIANTISNNKSRVIPGYYPLGYEDVLIILKMSYDKKY